MMAGPIRNVSPGSAAAIAMTKPTAPRPPNAWILYRSDKLKELPPLLPGERRAQAEVSRMISTLWKHETDGTRQYYERLADEKKAEHSIKYPGYRFQPMKKEEKVALREQRKLEKEAERKARQQRGRQPQQAQASIQIPQPAPALPAPQHNHIYPPMNPGSIYYPMELFGPAGPSPPVSIASSPESTPESTATSDESCELRNSQPPSVTATPSTLHATIALPSEYPARVPATGGNPYLAYLGPANNHLMYPQPHMMMSASIPGFATIALPAATPSLISTAGTSYIPTDNQYMDVRTGDNSQTAGLLSSGTTSLAHTTTESTDLTANMPSYMSDYDFQSAQYEQYGDNQITFQVDPSLFESIHTLLPPDSDCHNTLDAMRVGVDVFALPDFTDDVLNAHPSGELQIDFAQFPSFDFDRYINEGMLDSTTSSNTSLGQNDTTDAETHQALFEFLSLPSTGDDSPSTSSHPSMPATPSGSQVALSIDLSNTESSQKAAPYAPPSGAAHASSRRVGGSWKPPLFINNEGSFDHTSPCTAVGVSRS